MDNEFAHHGILGQKWGIRRYQNKDGTLTTAGRKRLQQDSSAKKSDPEKGGSTKKATSPQSSVETLSDDELRARISRLELEKRYKDLIRTPQKKSRGKEWVLNVLETSGADVSKQVSKYLMGVAVNKLFGTEVVNVGSKKEVDPHKKLKDKVSYLELTKKLSDLTTEDRDAALKDQVRRLSLEKQLEELTARKNAK